MLKWLWLILLSVSLKAQSPPVVLIDQTLGQPVYPFDEGPSGLQSFTSLFAPQTYNTVYDWIVPVTQNLDNALLNPQGKLLVLTPTINRSYSAQTVENIQNFVADGGNLLVFTEHDNYYNNSTALNRITRRFGITTLPNAYTKGSNLQDAWVKATCPTYGVKDMVFYLPATLNLRKGAKALAKADTAIVAATATYGKGKVAVVADYELVWNFALRDNPANKQFFQKLVTTFFKFTLPNADPNILLGLTVGTPVDSGLINYLTANGPMAQFILDLPLDLARLPNNININLYNHILPDEVDSLAKTVLFYDGSSNYMKMLQDNGGQNVLDALNYTDREPVINQVAKKFGLRFALQTLVDSCINDYTITLLPTGQKASCVSYIDTLACGNFTVFFTANTVGLDYNAPLGGEDATNNTCIPLPGGYAKKPKIVGLYNKRVFAIADMETFLHISNDKYLLNAFKTWLSLK